MRHLALEDIIPIVSNLLECCCFSLLDNTDFETLR